MLKHCGRSSCYSDVQMHVSVIVFNQTLLLAECITTLCVSISLVSQRQYNCFCAVTAVYMYAFHVDWSRTGGESSAENY
jgi:hypothetical protein